jgi:hypothetical protein
MAICEGNGLCLKTSVKAGSLPAILSLKRGQTMNTSTTLMPNDREIQRAEAARFQTKQSSADRLTISGRELSALLDPVTPESFEAEYWGRKPLVIRGGVEKLDGLIPGGFTLADFYRATREAEAKRVRGFHLWAQSRYTGDRPPDQIKIRADQIEEMVSAGANVASANLNDCRVATLAVALKAQLRFAGGVACAATLSPEGNGWPLHVDHSSTITIQCEGRKKFVVSAEPVVAWPRGPIIFGSDGAPQTFFHDPEPWEEEQQAQIGELIEVVLAPGDVMYWPAGTLHMTEALSATTLNLNFVLNHADFYWIITQWLRARFGPDPAWRHLPLVGRADVEPGRLPAEVATFFADRLEELLTELRALAPDGLELNCAWHRLVADPGEGTLTNLGLDASSDTPPIERQEVLRLSRRAPVTYAVGKDADGSTIFTLYFGNREVSATDEWAPFLGKIVGEGQFVAEAAMGWTGGDPQHPWEVAQEYLQALLSQGVLECEKNHKATEDTKNSL